MTMKGRRVLRAVATAVIAAALGAALCAAVIDRDHPRPQVLSALEIGFAQDMTAHHQQAVTMADMLAADASPEVTALAEQIRFTQLVEIGQMTGWLQLAGAAPSSTQPMTWMTDHGSAHHDHAVAMPGTATPDELARLQRSTGPDNETQFLTLMTRHHQGGIAMASYAFQRTGNDTVRRAASIMVTEQTEEIQLMTLMLDGHRGVR
ncbi:DUF305 domain-containing protein [Mycolicibacterium setense]|uniref:DUF305 domain-containing protein n=1 Tax=Mycolicibacterium setense TaxID=431269 RepID=UPI000573E36D|nr:DUF305 domain-containing protein [Mycolicibacterium setense]KHO18899.1 hypothetical protein QQ25_18860 [Mycolicibacterium setense]MCV7112733.1 DUF305 domain-containing protein [Mycolicibacterium setense]